jgi:hypothetical protein
VDEVFGVIHFHLQLFKDYALFFFDVVFFEERVADQIGHHVEGLGQMLIEDFYVVANQFLGGEGIETASDGVNRAGDLFGGSILGALEHHVLNEVGDAEFMRLLLAGSGADPNTYGDAPNVPHTFGDHTDPIGQSGTFNLAGFLSHSTLFYAPGPLR